MIINFRLDKIHIERKNQPKGNIEAKNNLKVIDIDHESLSALTKQKALNFKFLFSVVYEPDIAKAEIGGNVTYMADEKQIKEIVEKWKKEKWRG